MTHTNFLSGSVTVTLTEVEGGYTTSVITSRGVYGDEKVFATRSSAISDLMRYTLPLARRDLKKDPSYSLLTGSVETGNVDHLQRVLMHQIVMHDQAYNLLALIARNDSAVRTEPALNHVIIDDVNITRREFLKKKRGSDLGVSFMEGLRIMGYLSREDSSITEKGRSVLRREEGQWWVKNCSTTPISFRAIDYI